MKSFNFKQLLPHLIAIGVFLLVAGIFCKPAFDSSLTLSQGDVSKWKEMSHQSFEYKERYGHFPLWISNMFSGMPAFQVAADAKWSPLELVDKTMQLYLPQPVNFFFLACICFYILCLCLGLSPFVAILGSLGFAFSTYSPIIITAGHNTKMLALAYAPAVLGAIVLIFKRRYLLGFTLATLFIALQIAQNHQQISYYLFFIIVAMSLAYLIRFIREKAYIHIMKSTGILILAGIIGVACSAISLISVYDFSKESKRGGQLMMNGQNNNADKMEGGKTSGLSKDYAFQWSYGKDETWTLLIPGALGYGLHYAENESGSNLFPQLDEDSKTLEEVRTIQNPDVANSVFNYVQQGIYWGAQPFTNGPVFLGALICLLFILGMFMLDNQHKWWIFGVTVFSILLAWGDNFASFNYWLFDHLPLYNKFRAPTMALVIPQLVCPLLAVMLIDKLVTQIDDKDWIQFKKGMIVAGAILVLAFTVHGASEFSNENKSRTKELISLLEKGGSNPFEILQSKGKSYEASSDNNLYEKILIECINARMPDAKEKSRSILTALENDRKSIFQKDLMRTFVLMLLGGILIALYLKKKLKPVVLIVGTLLLSSYDLLSMGSNYLNQYSFKNKTDAEEVESKTTQADQQILADKDPNFRVFDPRQLNESRTSYYHKSIGGYHPAKLGIYDDLLAYQLSGNANPRVLNMLNAKYRIEYDQRGQSVAVSNPNAMGNAWFVNGIQWVKGPVEEMQSLNSFNPKDTAIVDIAFKSAISETGIADSTDKINLTKFNNDTIQYTSNTKNSRIAIFSEIYYKDWKAYIDGKPAKIFKANYVLRGLTIPAGTHQITFQFEPTLFMLGREISFYASWLTFLILMGYVGIIFWRKMES